MAFGKKNAEQRKDWINSFQEGTCINYNQKSIRYKDFVDQELILFSMYDNMRSIPSMCDGFKPGQRKILYACFKRNLTAEIKVAQLSGYIGEHTAYHHGELSLSEAIIGMAQNFVGSNNINLLMPLGQFGSRHLGGKEAASPRYIYTMLSKLARCIFRPEDDPLMEYQVEEGQKIEPLWYLPIIPMILVNGCEGIGTGWRSTIPNYNPREIVANIRGKLHGKEFARMTPWFKNYKGAIVYSEGKKDKSYTCYGIFNVKDESTVTITELPIRRWTRDYKDFLESQIEGAPKVKEAKSKKEGKKERRGKKGRDGKKKKAVAKEEGKGEEEKKGKGKRRKQQDPGIVVEDIKEYHIGHDIHFEVKVKKECLAELVKANNQELMYKAFKLTTHIPMTQFVCFDANCKLRKYKNELEILEEFFDLRLVMYQKRKTYLMRQFNRELSIIDNKVRFILGVIDEKIIIKRQKKKALVNKLHEMKFTPYSEFGKAREESKEERVLVVNSNEEAPAEGEAQVPEKEEEDEKGQVVPAKEYDYLLRMPLWALTYEKVEELLAEKDAKQKRRDILSVKTESQLWEDDLDAFQEMLDSVEKEEAITAANDATGSAPVTGLKKTRARRKKPAGAEGKKESKKESKKEAKKETKKRGKSKKRDDASSQNKKEGLLDKFVQKEKEVTETKVAMVEMSPSKRVKTEKTSTEERTVTITRKVSEARFTDDASDKGMGVDDDESSSSSGDSNEE